MKTLYLECNMGAAGDMLTAALWELLDETRREEFLNTMNGLGLPGVGGCGRKKAAQCGIWGHPYAGEGARRGRGKPGREPGAHSRTRP